MHRKPRIIVMHMIPASDAGILRITGAVMLGFCAYIEEKGFESIEENRALAFETGSLH
jgi:hypothetical protein